MDQRKNSVTTATTAPNHSSSYTTTTATTATTIGTTTTTTANFFVSPPSNPPSRPSLRTQEDGGITNFEGGQNLEQPSTRLPNSLCENLTPNNILFGNVRGLYPQTDKTKPSVLLDLAKMKNCFLISLTETHLTSNISNVELTTEGWDLYRTDRLERFGGGVAVYIKQSFSVSDQLSFSSDMCELLGLYLPLS